MQWCSWNNCNLTINNHYKIVLLFYHSKQKMIISSTRGYRHQSFTCTQLYERVYIFARKWSVVATTYSAPFQLKKNLATPVIKQIHAQAHTSAIFSFLRTCACFVVLHKPKSYESQNPQVTMHSKTKIVKKDSRFTLFKLTFLIPAPEMIWWRMLGYNRLILIVLLQLDK